MTEVDYVLVCRNCGDGEDALPMPFSSAADRGKWAAQHKRATGHEHWLVVDQPRNANDPPHPGG